MDIVKILALIIIACALAVILKPQKQEYSFFISLAAGITVLIFASDKIISAVNIINGKIDEYGISTQYFAVALKSLGIAYISAFIADICRDCGQSSLAQKAELAGKCAIFIMCVPLSVTLLTTVLEFI